MPFAKFETKPETEILGQAILAVTASMNFETYKHLFDAGLKKYNFEMPIDPDTWYPLQMLLDIYKSFYDEPNASSNLVSVGVKVIEASPFPPEVDSIVKAVETLNYIYTVYVRNFVPGTEYEIEVVSDEEIKVTDHTRFPHDLVYGYMFAIGKRFAPAGKHIIVTREYLDTENPNADGAIYYFKTK